jgi:glycosyltransferase involved in cell wall biosynthesis
VVGEAAGLLEPDNVGQMQLALTRMTGHTAWREQLRAAGLRNAARFNWTENAARVVECYRAAAGQTGAGT